MREDNRKMKIEKKWKNCRVLLLFLVGHRREKKYYCFLIFFKKIFFVHFGIAQNEPKG